jgi:predicted amidohydrolase YtcJ
MTDRILRAGTVITMDPSRPRAEAVAVSDGRIVAVGSMEHAERPPPALKSSTPVRPPCCRV